VTRIDSVRAATGSARDSVLHAAEVVAPYADSARDRATHYAREARERLAPRVSVAAGQARAQYDAHLAPRIEHARGHVPPMVDEAAGRARDAARQAAAVSRPRIEQAIAAAGPVRKQATDRSTATLAALRGQISAKEVRCIVRRRRRRAQASRAAMGALLVGLLTGGAFAVWKWWDKQANPDWLVEPPAPTEMPDGSRISSVDGSDGARSLDPDVRARQDEARAAERIARERRNGRQGRRGEGDEGDEA
jgi:hypothetical protein